MSKTSKKKTNGSGIGRFMFALVLAIGVFVAIVAIQTKITEKYEKAKVIVAAQTIPAKQDITEENFNTFFKIVEKDKKKIAEGAFVEGDEHLLYDTITTQEIAMNQDITANMRQEKSEIENAIAKLGDIDTEDLVVSSFSIDSIAQGVAGTLRRGDIVDITVYYVPKDEEDERLTLEVDDVELVKAENVYIAHAYDGGGVEIQPGDTTTTATLFTVVADAEKIDEINTQKMAHGSYFNIVRKSNVNF